MGTALMLAQDPEQSNFGKLYAGILITATSISFAVGRLVKTPEETVPFAFAPYDDARFNKSIPIDGFVDASQKLNLVAAHLMTLGDELGGVGIASYGPLLAVGIKQRDQRYRVLRKSAFKISHIGEVRDENDNVWPYGTVSPNTPHKQLINSAAEPPEGLDIYDIVRSQFNDSSNPKNDVGVAIQTDVTCGALSESFHTNFRNRITEHKGRRLEEDIVVFLHLCDGIGGGFVVNKKTVGSANHPEIGCVSLGLEPDSDALLTSVSTGSSKQRKPISVQSQVSIGSILAKSGKQEWKDLQYEDWAYAVDHVARLCATITFILGPHQIVLHGPISRLRRSAKTGDSFPELVLERLPLWMTFEDKPHITYSELSEGDYITGAIHPEWKTSAEENGCLDPMLYGALIYGAQIPPEYSEIGNG